MIDKYGLGLFEFIFGLIIVVGFYYIIYRVLIYIVKKGVKEALAEPCESCKKIK